MDPVAIGVDIGGSHIYSAAVDLKTHQIIHGTGFNQEINNKAASGEILDGWGHGLSQTLSLIDLNSLAGIGFAMPGPFDYPNGIALFERVEKYESLYGVNVSEALGKRLEIPVNIPFRYINDATAFAIAEAWVGKAGNYDRMIALTLGTGFGSAFIRDGLPVLEGEMVPEMGCVWHLRYKDSIANNYFSTHWFTGTYLERTGKSITWVKELADIAAYDPTALVLFEEYGTGMGRFLAPWIKQFNAEVIVIGGNITGAYSLFSQHLLYALKQSDNDIPIYLSDLKEDAAVLGSARLLVDDYWVRIKSLLSKM